MLKLHGWRVIRRSIGDEQVSGEHDLLIRQVNDKITAGVCRRPVIAAEADAIDGQDFIFGDRLCGKTFQGCGIARPAEASISFLQFSCAMMVMPEGKAGKPLIWSPSLWVMMTVHGFWRDLGDFGQHFFCDSSVVFASTTMTPVVPTIISVFTPAPPWAQ